MGICPKSLYGDEGGLSIKRLVRPSYPCRALDHFHRAVSDSRGKIEENRQEMESSE